MFYITAAKITLFFENTRKNLAVIFFYRSATPTQPPKSALPKNKKILD